MSTRKPPTPKPTPQTSKYPRPRAEMVKGNSFDEWVANLSPEFKNLGDARLAWVNEGDYWADNKP